MVANNKNLDADRKQTAAPNVVGPVVLSQNTQLHQNINKKKLFSILLGLVVLGVFAFTAVKLLHIGNKVYAQAAGHKIYKQEIQSVLGYHSHISSHQAATVLADKYLTEAMAKQEGITVTNQDIINKFGPGITAQEKTNPYAYQYQVNQLYFDRIQNHQEGVYTGQLLVAQFSRYIPYKSPLLAEKKAAEPNIGNAAAITADKKYAQDFITGLYNQVKAGKLTFDQAIQAEHNDPVVGESAYQTLSHSGSFDTSKNQASLLQPVSAQEQIRGLKAGQISKPFVVRVSDSADGNSTAESYFLVVKMDSISGNPNGMSFDQYLAQEQKQLGYKVYV